MTMMVRSFQVNIPDVVVVVLMLMLMAMTNNEVAVVNADIITNIAAPVGVGDHKYSDHNMVVNIAAPIGVGDTKSSDHMLVGGDEINNIVIPHQNDHRGLQERGACENDSTFLYKGKAGKDCATWVPTKDSNCRKSQLDADGKKTGKQVKFYCPIQCKPDKCAEITGVPTTSPTISTPPTYYPTSLPVPTTSPTITTLPTYSPSSPPSQPPRRPCPYYYISNRLIPICTCAVNDCVHQFDACDDYQPCKGEIEECFNKDSFKKFRKCRNNLHNSGGSRGNALKQCMRQMECK